MASRFVLLNTAFVEKIQINKFWNDIFIIFRQMDLAYRNLSYHYRYIVFRVMGEYTKPYVEINEKKKEL